jgi:DNA-binding response OmpR family regulator
MLDVSDKPVVLLVDPDPVTQKPIASAYTRGGCNCRFIREPKKTAGALRMLQPDVVVLHAELGSPTAKDVLDGLASDVAFANVPVVLLCASTQDARFVAQAKTGIVELLALPFNPRYIDRLKALLTELPDRGGRLSGQGPRAELVALVDHLRRAQRSGVLEVDPLTPDEGKAFFANGALRSAQQGLRSGSAALSAMLARPTAQWTFSEMGDVDESAAVVIEVGADEPIASPVVAEPDEGISLDIEAPISEEILLEDIVEDLPTRAPVGPPTPILLVDDDAELCQMFGRFFKKHGFEVATTADGVAGFDAALGTPFEAIVADLNMPRMDGWGLLRLLREDFRTRETPVAFLSCHDDYRESLRALDAGAQAYLSKSTRLDALAIQVRELLEPRVAFKKALSLEKPFTVGLAQVGPQWALRQSCASGTSGRLDAKDNWANFVLCFRDGVLLHARSHSGRHVAEGERALANFMASRGAEGSLSFGEFPCPRTVTGALEEALARCAGILNQNEKNLRDELMVLGKEIHVNADLYKLYSQVGPKPWLETARLLCEDKLTPKEVLARADVSPLEVEEAMRDLIRRGVVRLTA